MKSVDHCFLKPQMVREISFFTSPQTKDIEFSISEKLE